MNSKIMLVPLIAVGFVLMGRPTVTQASPAGDAQLVSADSLEAVSLGSPNNGNNGNGNGNGNNGNGNNGNNGSGGNPGGGKPPEPPGQSKDKSPKKPK